MVSIFARTLIIYILLTIGMKIMGKRELGELDVSELVSTLLVSEIAAIPIDDPDIPLLNAIIPILFIISLEIIVSALKTKSNQIKKCIEGNASFIIFKGKLRQKALLDNRISINEFLSEARAQSVGNLKEISYAILEANGKISLLKKEKQLPVAHAIIIDGEFNKTEAEPLGFDEERIESYLKSRKISREKVFLMTIDDQEKTEVIIKEEYEA